MNMSKRKSNASPSNLSLLLKPEDYAKVDSLSKIALPLTLNEYYLPFIENVKDCLLFLERFSDEDETIANLLKVYNSNPKLFNKLSDKLDLDKLADKAGLSKGEFRRLINATLDILGDEEAMMLLRLNKRHLVKKSIEIGLTDKHPDSFEERHALMQYYGLHVVPKNSQVNINVDKSTNTSLSQTQIGLPAFSTTISHSEKIASEQIKNLIDLDNLEKPKQIESSKNFIDFSTQNNEDDKETKPLIVKPIEVINVEEMEDNEEDGD